MKKLILLAIFCFNPLFIEQNISNVYLKSCKKATQKNVWQENGCKANVLYAAVTRCRNTKKGLMYYTQRSPVAETQKKDWYADL